MERSHSVLKVNLENELNLMYMLVYIEIFNVHFKSIDSLRHEYVHDLSPKHPAFPPNETEYLFLFSDLTL